MKTGIVAVMAAAIVTVAGIGYSFINEKGGTSSSPPSIHDIVHVDILAANPDAYKVEFVLRGVVAGINRDQGIFAVIDAREFEACGVLSCALNTIPISFSGNPPPIKTVVDITGLVARNQKGLVLKATQVEVVK